MVSLDECRTQSYLSHLGYHWTLDDWKWSLNSNCFQADEQLRVWQKPHQVMGPAC